MVNLNAWVDKKQEGVLIDFGVHLEPEVISKALEMLYDIVDNYIPEIEKEFNETV